MIPASLSRALCSVSLVVIVAGAAACGGGGKSATGGMGGGVGAGGMGGTAAVAIGPVLHVVPGVPAPGANGAEATPFSSLQLALAAIETNPGWDGTIIMHPGRHEFPAEVILPLTADLQIMAGATLAMGPSISFHCFRDVKVMGTEAAPVLFTWLTEGMHWGSFTLFGVTAQSSVVQYAIFEHSGESQYGGIGVRGGLSLADASAHISHCIFRNAAGDDGLNMKRSGSIIESSLFENNCCDAFDADGASAVQAQAFNNIFRNNGNDGFDIGEGALIRIHHNSIFMSGDKGISNGDGSKAVIDHNLIVGCAIGIGIKDDSDPIATNNTLYGNGVGLRGYHHIDTFGPGKGTFTNGIIWGSTGGPGSDFQIDGGATTVVSYSCVGTGAPGVGNTTVGMGCDDPMFADVANNDFHLKSATGRWNPATMAFVMDTVSSPCIDGGDPLTPIGDETAPNGAIVDMGCYGGTAEASHSK